MGVVEIIIIYLAFGAPFAIFEAAVPAGSARRTASMMFALAAWPAYAGKLLLFRPEPEAAFVTGAPLLSIRERLEVLLTEGDAQAVFEFREVFDRYTGLAAASRYPAAVSYEILEISGHASPAAGARCLERRNAFKLERHLAAARNEFHSLATSLAQELRRQQAAKTLLHELETVLFAAAAEPDEAAHRPQLSSPRFIHATDKLRPN